MGVGVREGVRRTERLLRECVREGGRRLRKWRGLVGGGGARREEAREGGGGEDAHVLLLLLCN